MHSCTAPNLSVEKFLIIYIILVVRIGIFYFTGTGNTEFIVRELKIIFDTKHTTEIYNIETLPKNLEFLQLNQYDMLVFGAPVYGFNAPRIFIKFLQRLPESRAKPTVLFLNAAGEALAALNYPSSILHQKGYEITNRTIYYLPSNIFLKKREHENLIFELFGLSGKQNINTMFAACRTQIKQTAEMILRGETYAAPTRFWKLIISELFRPVFYISTALHMKYFMYANKNCNQCGICIKACPTNNISMSMHRVTFGTLCTVCYRCVNICPGLAIHLRPPFGFLDNRVQYLAPGWKPPLPNQ